MCQNKETLISICISLLLIRICQKTINCPPIKGLICLSNAPFANKLSVQYRLPGTPKWSSIWQCTTIAISSALSTRSWCGPKGGDGKWTETTPKCATQKLAKSWERSGSSYRTRWKSLLLKRPFVFDVSIRSTTPTTDTGHDERTAWKATTRSCKVTDSANRSLCTRTLARRLPPVSWPIPCHRITNRQCFHQGIPITRSTVTQASTFPRPATCPPVTCRLFQFGHQRSRLGMATCPQPHHRITSNHHASPYPAKVLFEQSTQGAFLKLKRNCPALGVQTWPGIILAGLILPSRLNYNTPKNTFSFCST